MNKEQEPNQIALTSPDGKEARLAELRRLFPDLFDGEGALDEKALRQLVSDEAGHIRERFRFEWAGKAQSKRFAFAPSKATLVYDPERSVNADGTASKPGESLQDNTSQNLLIEGDNLEVLKQLQASYFEKVKCIYIDPPYNTGSNYIYPNDYSQDRKTYWEDSGTVREGVKLVANPESSGRFHSNWLNMMQPRLLLARKLLRSDGVLICAIDENELDTLSLLLKEVFGEGEYEHFYASVQHNPRGQQGENFSYTNEYVIFVYPSDGKVIADRKLSPEEVDWSQFRNWGGESLRTDAKNCFYPVIVEGEKVVGFGEVCADDFHPRQTEIAGGKAYVYPIDNDGVERKWRYARQSVDDISHLLRARKTDSGYQIELGKDFGTYKSLWTDTRYDSNEYGTKVLNELVPDAGFTYPKSLWSVYDAISTAVENDKSAIVMDFFAGSGTTGHAVMQKNKDDGGNRKYICVQVPEVIVPTGNKNQKEKMQRAIDAGYKTIFDITRDRLLRAGHKLHGENAFVGDTGFRVMALRASNFPQNTFTPDPTKSEIENLKALDDHLQAAAQLRLFGDDGFHSVVTEIALKNGFGLFYTLERLDDLSKNTVYRMQGNDKDAILCLDGELQGETLEALKAYSDNQLIVLKAALDTTKKFELQTAFQDNLWVV
jgi:adenine-specific DNA-methyltransferase